MASLALLIISASSPRAWITFTYPRSYRVDLTNSFLHIPLQKRARCDAKFCMFNFTRIFINHITIGIQKVMEVHIEIFGNKARIQSRPGNPYLFTASTTSLTVEIHDNTISSNSGTGLQKKPPSISCRWLLAALTFTGGTTCLTPIPRYAPSR